MSANIVRARNNEAAWICQSVVPRLQVGRPMFARGIIWKPE